MDFLTVLFTLALIGVISLGLLALWVYEWLMGKREK